MCRGAQSQRMTLTSDRIGPCYFLFVFLLSMVLVFAVLPIRAQNRAHSEYEVKAAFLFNFAKFIDWPESAFPTQQSPFTVCVIGPDPFGHALEENLLGKAIDERSVEIDRLKPDDISAPNHCQMAFVSSAEKQQFAGLIAKFQGTSTLLIGDAEGFAASGGMIELRLEDNRVRFAINPDAAGRANLQLSSKLLALAEIVHGGLGNGKD